MPLFSLDSEKKLATCHADLQRVCNEAIKYFNFTVVCGIRGKEEQNKAFNEKKSKTPWPMSKHNAIPPKLSNAVDLAPFPIKWNDTDRFYYLAGFIMGIAAKMGIQLRYGGDWDRDTEVQDEKFKDIGHFEVV